MADTTRKDPAKKPSVTSHKLFPAVVIVWFAALFGLASLAIRPASIESLVLATGIDHVIAQAAPPLGNTMRILLSLLLTGFGALVGLVVARRLAKPTSAPATRRRHAQPADDAIPPVAAFGRKDPVTAIEDDEDEVQPIARRRQQLALLDEDDSLDDQAPLPGNGPILDVAELPLKSFDEVDGIWLHESDRSSAREEPTPEKKQANGFAHDLRDDDEDHAERPGHGLDTASADEANGASSKPNNRLFDSYVRRLNAGVGSNDSDATAPGFVSLRPIEAVDGTAEVAAAENAAEPVASQSPAFISAERTPDNLAYGNTAERIASAPLDELSHVELLERLAQTIARRRAERAHASESAPAPALAAAEPEETLNVTVLPRFAAPQPARAESDLPAALRPHWADLQDDDADDALPAYVPPRSIAMPQSAAPQGLDAAPVNDGDDNEILEEGYSTLRGISKPAFDPETDRGVEPEPADEPKPSRFAFPVAQNDSRIPSVGPAGPRMFDAPQAGEAAPDQTEQALRAALATLRRMSGTA